MVKNAHIYTLPDDSSWTLILEKVQMSSVSRVSLCSEQPFSPSPRFTCRSLSVSSLSLSPSPGGESEELCLTDFEPRTHESRRSSFAERPDYKPSFQCPETEAEVVELNSPNIEVRWIDRNRQPKVACKKSSCTMVVTSSLSCRIMGLSETCERLRSFRRLVA